MRNNPLNYIQLEESVGDKVRFREVYKREIANVPLSYIFTYCRYCCLRIWIEIRLFGFRMLKFCC